MSLISYLWSIINALIWLHYFSRSSKYATFICILSLSKVAERVILKRLKERNPPSSGLLTEARLGKSTDRRVRHEQCQPQSPHSRYIPRHPAAVRQSSKFLDTHNRNPIDRSFQSQSGLLDLFPADNLSLYRRWHRWHSAHQFLASLCSAPTSLHCPLGVVCALEAPHQSVLSGT